MMKPTLPIEEALRLTDEDALKAEIQNRVFNINQCVGELYPDIMRGEAERLTTRWLSLGKAS